MIQTGLLAAIALLAGMVVPASADWLNSRTALSDATEDLRRAQQLYDSLRGRIVQGRQDGQHQADSGAVIRPPDANIDPKMTLPPPNPHGTMRIIPPPGAPGGNPNVEPR